MSTQPKEDLHRKIIFVTARLRVLTNKLWHADRKVLEQSAYIRQLEEMIYVHVDPTGFTGQNEKICQDITNRVNEEPVDESDQARVSA